MGARLTLAFVLSSLLVACSNQPSKLDSMVSADLPSSSSSSSSGASSSSDDNDNGDNPLGGLGDLQGMLTKVGEALKKPGPYEAPEQSKDYEAGKPHWGVLDLSGGVVERQAYSWSGSTGTELRTLTERLRDLSDDANLTGILIRLGGLGMSMPDAVELRDYLAKLRAANKKVICHTENAGDTEYFVLAACETIGLAPLGTIAITGPSAMPIHVKPLLDKFGVTADFLHVGAYKGAAEPLTRDAPSNEMKEVLGTILDRRYETLVNAIAAGRSLDAANVKTLIDGAIHPSPQALEAKLVDDVASFEDFRTKHVTQPWTELELDPTSKDQFAAMMKIGRFFGAMPPEKPFGDHVALVYALGNIVDGDGEGLLGARQQIASHTLVAALRAIAADDTVKAVVLRIDSGGGSAQASELIWQAVSELKAKKPVVVSMSDVAASGGYYIAAGATKIFALDDTLTGSIGVVGGKIAPGPALAKLGVNTFPMGRGKHATIMASLGPWSAEEKAIMYKMMKDIYDVFTGRVAAGRSGKIKDVEAIAQGRVWTGTKAKELGLVDEIGGLDAALAEARTLAKLDKDAGIAVYPPAPTLRDFLVGFEGVRAPVSASSALDAALEGVSPDLASEVRRLLDLALSFRSTAIQTVAVLPPIR